MVDKFTGERITQMTTKNYIDVKCGIYDTQYTVRDHGDHIIVVAPYIKWVGNSGNLAFSSSRIDDAAGITLIRAMVEADETIIGYDNNCGYLTIDEVLDGHRATLTAFD